MAIKHHSTMNWAAAASMLLAAIIASAPIATLWALADKAREVLP